MRVAAVGDVHCKKTSTGAFQGLFAAMAAAADVIVLCGDLTDLGLAEEARVLAKELSAATTHPGGRRARQPRLRVRARPIR